MSKYFGVGGFITEQICINSASKSLFTFSFFFFLTEIKEADGSSQIKQEPDPTW